MHWLSFSAESNSFVMSNIILSPCHYIYCSIYFSWLFKRQACLRCESVSISDFSIEINSEETRHKRVGVKMENKLKFNFDAKYVENNYSSYMSWNKFYFNTCKVTAVMIAIWNWKYWIPPFGVFFWVTGQPSGETDWWINHDNQPSNFLSWSYVSSLLLNYQFFRNIWKPLIIF